MRFELPKGPIELHPIFHFTPKRIESHVTICFVAFKVYKELERITKIERVNLSADEVLNIAKTITTIKVWLPKSDTVMTKTMLLTPRHQSIADLIYCNL